jgi:hypothetical protein
MQNVDLVREIGFSARAPGNVKKRHSTTLSRTPFRHLTQFQLNNPAGDPMTRSGAQADSGSSEGRAMSTQKLFSVALCLVAADYSNSANAQQAEGTKAEAALTAKIKCEDFRKNADGTWTSGPNTKIGTNAFSNHTFDTRGVSIGGADLATILNRKCGR